RSACFFVVRVLTDPDIPASGGAFEPVTVLAPERSLVNASPPAAVVAGNTETSSRITDVVLSAFGGAVDVPAQGAGTMSNTTFERTYGRTTRRWAEERARGPAPTGLRPSTSRCPTRSTRRSRRSSSRIRSGSSGTRSAAGRAG